MRPSRHVLRIICALTCIMGAALLALGLQVSLSAHLQASAAALAALGVFVMLFSAVGFVGAGREKSALLMLYFFLNFFLVTCLFLASYAALAFQDSMTAWLKVHWGDPVLAALREQSCCADFASASAHLRHEFLTLGLMGAACLVLVLGAMYCVVRIVTVPIVMKSLLTVINLIFILLGVAIFAYGCAVKSRDELTAGQHWIAVVFIVVGTLIFGLALIGIIGSRSKSRSLLFLYIVGMGVCLTALVVCAAVSFAWSDTITEHYNTTLETQVDTVACDLSLPGCTNCTDTVADWTPCLGVTQRQNDSIWESCSSTTTDCREGWTLLNAEADQGYTANDIAECGQCPEWSYDDVHAYLQSGLQLLGLFAAVGCFFIVVGFAAALVLRKSLAGYQTDSI